MYMYTQTHRLQWHCLLRNIACSCRACSPCSRRIATIISPLQMNCMTEEWCRTASSYSDIRSWYNVIEILYMTNVGGIIYTMKIWGRYKIKNKCSCLEV